MLPLNEIPKWFYCMKGNSSFKKRCHYSLNNLHYLFILINLFYFIYLIFGCVGSSLLCAGFSLVAASGSYSSLQCTGFSLWWLLLLGVWALSTRASVVVARGLQSAGSVVVVHRLSCSTARGIFPDQGSNLCLLHWQADS